MFLTRTHVSRHACTDKSTQTDKHSSEMRSQIQTTCSCRWSLDMAINVSEMSFPTATTTVWEREPIDLPFAFLTYMLHSTGVWLLINFLKIRAAQKTRALAICQDWDKTHKNKNPIFVAIFSLPRRVFTNIYTFAVLRDFAISSIFCLLVFRTSFFYFMVEINTKNKMCLFITEQC